MPQLYPLLALAGRGSLDKAIQRAPDEYQVTALSRSRRSRPPGRRRWVPGRAIVVKAVVVVAALLLSTVVWAGARGAPVRTDLLQVGQLMQRLQQQLVSHDISGARVTLATLQDRARSARSSTSGFDWWLGAKLPGIGVDLAAVRTVASVLDDLSQQALPTMVDLVDGFDFATFVPKGGRLDLTALQHAAPGITKVDSAAHLAADRIAAIPSAELLSPLRDPVR